MNRHSKFCDRCGSKLPEGDEWPKTCPGHKGLVFVNPTPISVMVIPVRHKDDFGRFGILVGRRNHEPAKGTFGLPGGFHDDKPEGETLMQGAIREVREETGLVLCENDVRHHYEYPNPAQSQTLVFYRYLTPLVIGLDFEVGPCNVSPECDELDVIWNPVQLAFQSHTNAAKIWFSLYG